jgi:adenosylmethionine---8-amino-7-oxononanoate aminotransferase
MTNTVLWRPYTQMKSAAPPLTAVRTEGSRIHLADGRMLIDGIASWWTACHGYNHPDIRAAVERQLAAMPHVMFGGLTHEPAERLGARLVSIAPGSLDHVFFSDSGSVAVEIAMKMAVQFWLNSGWAGRTRFIAFRDAYHGDTMGAMSVCDPQTSMHAGLQAYLPKQIFAELPRTPAQLQALDELLAAHADDLAAVIIEPLAQGAGGMRFHPPQVLADIAAAARRHQTLLIADEVFTGFGRTGSMFGCQQAGVAPDILCVSKALTGGTLGLAATLATDRIFGAFWSDDSGAALMHGPTFMANPLACAAANASLDLFEQEPRLEQAKSLEKAMADGLAPCRALPHVVDVRTKGAIGVVELSAMPNGEKFRQAFVEQGVWVRPFGNIVYLTPALTIDSSDLGRLCTAIVTVLKTTAADDDQPADPRA